jgi:hypothetical protein
MAMSESSNPPRTKPQRTPERAAAILDRAARMSQYRPNLIDRGMTEKKIRTPGNVWAPFRMNDITTDQVRGRGSVDIPLSRVRSEQTTVSLEGVKKKLLDPKGSSAKPQVIKHGDWYYVHDGNHRITAARALGQTTINAHVGELMGGRPGAPQIRRPSPPMSGVNKAGVAIATAGPLVSGVNAYNRALASGGSHSDAMAAAAGDAMKTAAVGMAAASTFATVAKGVRAAAPRLAPALGPIGWAAAAGMAAYGAYQGYSATGTIKGAAMGAIGLDVMPSASSTDMRTASVSSVPHEAWGALKTPAAQPGTMTPGDAKRIETANAAFSRQQAAQSSGQADEGQGSGPRGWANPAVQFAAQQARGVQQFSDWAETGRK